MRRLTLTLLVLSLASPASAGIFRRRVRPVQAPVAHFTYQAPAPQYAPAPTQKGGHWAYQRSNCASGQCTVTKVWVAN